MLLGEIGHHLFLLLLPGRLQGLQAYVQTSNLGNIGLPLLLVPPVLGQQRLELRQRLLVAGSQVIIDSEAIILELLDLNLR